MKLNTILISMFLLGALLLTISCKKGNGGLTNMDVTSQINDLPKESLNEDELGSLQLMREEEKLARDVYTVLYDKWRVNVFANISSSEQKHTDAILTLLTKYGLSDPVGGNVVGVFSYLKIAGFIHPIGNIRKHLSFGCLPGWCHYRRSGYLRFKKCLTEIRQSGYKICI